MMAKNLPAKQNFAATKQKHTFMKLLVTAAVCGTLLLTACGGSDKKDGNTAETKKETAAPAALKPTDLTANGIALTIQAPEGATIKKDDLSGGVSVVKDHFNITVAEEKYAEEGATTASLKAAALEQDMKMNNDAALGMKMEVFAETTTGYLYQVTNGMGAKMVRFKQFITKDNKLFKIEENFLALNDAEKSMETGYAISREEAEAMYNAVKQ
jgi:uncharacterized protein YrrD/outer membrane murein-binding lipoprotein Lpp